MHTPSELFGQLIAIQTLVKLHHWAVSRSRDAYATHIALNEYYDAMSDLIDNIIETYQGKYAIVPIKIAAVAIAMPITDKLKAFAEMIESCMAFGERTTNTYLYNQMDEIASATYKTIYKLVNLKDS
jgi:DNA-binding ferritin-like protein